MSTSRSKQERVSTYVGVTILVLFFAVFLFCIIYFGNKQEDKEDRNAEFKGACTVLGGKVTDDLCIKDDRVILTQKEYESRETP